MTQESGFFYDMARQTPSAMGEMTLLHRSESGPCELYRTMKDGSFRVFKALKPGFRGDPIYESMLHKEYLIGYGMEHPFICRTYSFHEVPGLGNCIELEWIDGRDLDMFMAEKPDGKLVRKVISELCSAMSYMHRRQVVHRDLKPSNILICHNGDNVKLIDFGVSDTDSSCIHKGPAGTVCYAAPEALSDGKVDARSDIWSLGAILSRYGLFPKLAACCMRRDPDERYQSVDELGHAVKRLRSRRFWAVAGILTVISFIMVALALFNGNSNADDCFESVTEAIENANSLDNSSK